MVLEKKIQYIKKNHKSPISFDDIFYYFVIVVLSSILVYFSYGVIPSIYQNGISIKSLLMLLLIGLMFLGLIVLLIIEARKNRRFIELELTGDFESSKNTIILAARKALKVAEISINEELGLIYIDTKRSTFSISTGEKVTIIKKGNRLLINSRSEYLQATLYFDYKNIKRLTKEINKLKAVNIT
jgi:hypothetical protein